MPLSNQSKNVLLRGYNLSMPVVEGVVWGGGFVLETFRLFVARCLRVTHRSLLYGVLIEISMEDGDI